MKIAFMFIAGILSLVGAKASAQKYSSHNLGPNIDQDARSEDGDALLAVTVRRLDNIEFQETHPTLVAHSFDRKSSKA